VEKTLQNLKEIFHLKYRTCAEKIDNVLIERSRTQVNVLLSVQLFCGCHVLVTGSKAYEFNGFLLEPQFWYLRVSFRVMPCRSHPMSILVTATKNEVQMPCRDFTNLSSCTKRKSKIPARRLQFLTSKRIERLPLLSVIGKVTKTIKVESVNQSIGTGAWLRRGLWLHAICNSFSTTINKEMVGNGILRDTQEPRSLLCPPGEHRHGGAGRWGGMRGEGKEVGTDHDDLGRKGEVGAYTHRRVRDVLGKRIFIHHNSLFVTYDARLLVSMTQCCPRLLVYVRAAGESCRASYRTDLQLNRIIWSIVNATMALEAPTSATLQMGATSWWPARPIPGTTPGEAAEDNLTCLNSKSRHSNKFVYYVYYSCFVYHDISDEKAEDTLNVSSIKFTIWHYVPLLILFRFLQREIKYSKQHLVALTSIELMHDIESNPGPNLLLTLVTINCRGLGNINKFRLLLNKAYEYVQKGPAVICLQETMIVSDRYLELAWRGNYVHTPGLGNSQGCVTLLPSGVEVSSIQHLEHRGHSFLAKGLLEEETLIINLYAPIGFDEAKLQFFQEAFAVVEQHATENAIVMGDFNLTFMPEERRGHTATSAENRIADIVSSYIIDSGLADAWAGSEGFTWRRQGTLSRLDRVLTRLPNFRRRSITTNWSITKTDHAAVTVILEHIQKPKHKNGHTKLCNSIVTNPQSLAELRTYVIEQLATADELNMNPHNKLEFVKVTIRTKALELMSRQRKQQSVALAELEQEIQFNTRLLATNVDQLSQQVLIEAIERDKRAVETLLDEQGVILAKKAKSKWYNEGEKSNKYFLNLLKRNSDRAEMTRLFDGTKFVETDAEIRQVVTKYYQELYNNNAAICMDDTFLDTMFTVDEAHSAAIDAPLTLAELWASLKSVRATTPGPDGISNLYLKRLWDLIGPLILRAWEYSLEIGSLTISHKRSLLRLIPKAGKEPSLIKNWRPITLSNCDHKLITRLYNNRILKAIGGHVTPTQTAYIKGRNIADNLRLLGAAVTLAEHDPQIDATIIALDAQKAFDSVQHEYLKAILHRIGLSRFVPIFELLYKDLSNDVIINGSIGMGHTIGNGVKQGDALSCSLFLLAMEPVIRNITSNNVITAVTSQKLRYTWPVVLGYADDITIITHNTNVCVNEVFGEYQRLTAASGLTLNADKTEKFNITGALVNQALRNNYVMYNNMCYSIQTQDSIKINGIFYDMIARRMAALNYEGMKEKMHRHFMQWSKRDLSLLGKVQIIKTFGISQYLYALAVIDLDANQWVEINKLIYKFLWNKDYNLRHAPHRIKREIMLTPKELGGFGLVDMAHIMEATRIRRFAILRAQNNHPVAQLQLALGGYEYLRTTPILDLDKVTTSVLETLRHNILSAQLDMRPGLAETDLILHKQMLSAKLRWLVPAVRRASIEYNMLRARGYVTLGDVIKGSRGSTAMLRRIALPEIRTLLPLLDDEYRDRQLPEAEDKILIYDKDVAQWLNLAAVGSGTI
jgi:hypothetical protein